MLKDVVAQYARRHPAPLSLIERCSGLVAIMNARRAGRFLRWATPRLSRKEIVLLLRGTFVQIEIREPREQTPDTLRDTGYKASKTRRNASVSAISSMNECDELMRSQSKVRKMKH